MQGFHKEGISLLWILIGGEIVMLVGVLGIWPDIARIEDREGGWRRIGEWNIEVEELRRSLI